MQVSQVPPDLLTPAEVATALRVSPSTVSRWARNGTLRPVRVGGVLRFHRSEIAQLLEVGA